MVIQQAVVGMTPDSAVEKSVSTIPSTHSSEEFSVMMKQKIRSASVDSMARPTSGRRSSSSMLTRITGPRVCRVLSPSRNMTVNTTDSVG